MSADSKLRVGIGWMIDGSGAGISENMLLDIEGVDIRSVCKASAPMGDNDLDIDLRDYTVLPVLVDSHVHLTWSGTSDQDLRKAQLSPTYETAQETIKRHLDQHLACGIAAVRDGGDRFGHTLRFKNTPVYRSYTDIHIGAAGTAWHAPGRYGRLIGTAPAQTHLLPASIRAQEPPGDHVKLVNSGLNSLKEFGKETAPQFDPETLGQVVAAAHADHRKVMVHANGKLPVQIALAAGCDSIEHGFFMGYENLATMADTRATWVPTAVTMQAYVEQLSGKSVEADMARRNLEHQLEQLRLARQLGVVVAVGTDAGGLGVHHGTALAREIGLLIEAGYTPAESVACAGRNGMQLLSLNRQGILAPGMRADFIALRCSPDRMIDRLSQPDRIYRAGGIADFN